MTAEATVALEEWVDKPYQAAYARVRGSSFRGGGQSIRVATSQLQDAAR